MKSNTNTLARRTTIADDQPIRWSSLIAGLGAGVAQAVVFNPYDRALYLSVVHSRRFLSSSNWASPLQGVSQSVGGRAISGGLYFPLEHFCLQWCPSPLWAGTLAGAINALLCNPLAAIKYQTWGHDNNNTNMLQEALRMRRASGWRPFGNGLLPTIYRDLVFGGCYTFGRRKLHDQQTEHEYLANMIAAGLATILSGPFNYARNIQYATPSHLSAPPTAEVLRELLGEIAQASNKLVVVQNRLRIGWGTARVALGMAFAHTVYDYLHEYV